MTFPEMSEYIEGYEARRREEWERTRFMVHAVYQSQCTRELDRHEVLTFPWDDESSTETADSEDARAVLIQRAKEMEEYFRQNKVKNG